MTHTAAKQDQPALSVMLAADADAVRESQRLRYRIFAEEMGAQLESGESGLDQDHYDSYCHHLLVRDNASGEVVGSTRILTDDQAQLAGGFYSQNEFDLNGLLPLPGRIMEVGRTCIHSDYRSGGAIAVLWSGLARFMFINRFEYMMGCASIPMLDGGYQAHAIMEQIRDKYLADPEQRVAPRLALPDINQIPAADVFMPPLLKAYLRLGAKVCGEPCWDPDFSVADVFILLDMEHVNPRYQRHFLGKEYVEYKGAHENTAPNLSL
jgi:putative hemolysin